MLDVLNLRIGRSIYDSRLLVVFPILTLQIRIFVILLIMATEAVTRPSFCNQSWYCQDLPSDHQIYEEFLSLDRDVSAVLDHSSFSFGRYADELAWERWSVFSHNRRQEELEKFKTPGLVAQKKAFFDEYYKKVKAIKELQARQQEISKLVASQDIQGRTIPIENGTSSAVEFSDDYLDIPIEKAPSRCSASNSPNLSDGASSSITDVGFPSTPERVSHPQIPSAVICSKTVRQNGRVSSIVRPNINQGRKDDRLLKGKGIVNSAVIKTKPGNRTTEEVKRKSGIPKPSLHIGNSSKVEKRLPARKGITQSVASNITRRITEARSSVATLRASSPAKLVPSASGARDRKVKTAGNSSKVEKSLPASTGSTQTVGGNISKRMTEARSSVASMRASSRTKLVSSPSGVKDIKVKTVGNSSKIEKSLPTSTGSSRTVGSNINKQMTGARSSVATLCGLSRTKLVSSALGVRDNNVKTVGNSTKVEKNVPASTGSTKTDPRSSVTTVRTSAHIKLASSALSVRDDKGNKVSDTNCVRNILKTSLPVLSKLGSSKSSVADDKGKTTSDSNRSGKNLKTRHSKLGASATSVRVDKGKTTSNCSGNNIKTRLPVLSKPVSFPSSVRDGKGKSASDSPRSGSNSKTRPSVVSKSVKDTSKEVMVTRGSKNTNLSSRSVTTRPKDLRDKSKSNCSIAVGRHKKEGKREDVKRDEKICCFTSSCKASVPKLDHKNKILARPNADLKHARGKPIL